MSLNSCDITGRESSLSTRSTSRTNTPIKKTYKYRKVAEESQVDETLFKTSAVKLTKKPQGDGKRDNLHSTSTTKTLSIKTPLKGMPRTRNQYRIVKHSESYVDESLFGPPLPAPSFPAPWEKKDNSVKGQTLIWSPPVAGSMSVMQKLPEVARPRSSTGDRPFSAGATRPRSANGCRNQDTSNQKYNSPKQPWK
ncbi:RBPJ-interacting and tubulin-associated protein 1-like [Anneissia japonica]|uniref:RBPJ-interacting and tubulin-associated protein 1-like n=1 Tax=Anneissia japonica TaxID=1529436 RepID=UPI0014259D79|nr:RBPJ-interacting and tubulin-associated protein 1-like [Anneissia japonica]